jgi:lysophospholipase L1-like esterase
MSKYPKAERLFSLLGDISSFITITAIFLVIGHYLIGFAFSVATSVRLDPRAESPAYENYRDRSALWEEQNKMQKVHFEPYYHWKQPAYAGKYINIDHKSVRNTVREPDVIVGKKIFMFGGSTLWGHGSPDESTIPSIVQSLLGDEVDVYNYGEDGFVSTQELNYLLHQLALGNVPDVVIFYDGVNDGYAGAYSPAIPRDPQNLRMEYLNKSENGFIQWIAQSNYNKLAKYIVRKMRSGNSESQEWDKIVEPNIGINARGVVEMYEAHIKQVRALAKEYKFKAYFFWQPNLFSLTKKLLAHTEEITKNTSPVMVKSQHQVYLEAKEKFSKREKEKIFFLGNVFDDVERPIYFDWCHVGPEGNRLIAEKMVFLIGEDLRNLP